MEETSCDEDYSASAKPLAQSVPTQQIEDENADGPSFKEFSEPENPSDIGTTSLETITAQPSDIHACSASEGVMITGSESEHALADKRKLETELKTKEEKLNKLERDITEKDRALENCKREIDCLSSALQLERERHEKEIEQLRKKYETEKAEKKQIESEHAILLKEVAALREQVCELEKRCNESDKRAQRMEQCMEQHAKRMEQRHDEILSAIREMKLVD